MVGFKIRHAGPSTVHMINSNRHPGDGQRPSYRWKTVSRWMVGLAFAGMTEWEHNSIR